MSTSEDTPLLRSPEARECTENAGQRKANTDGVSTSKFPIVGRRRGRKWGGAAVAGAVMFAVAGAGLVAIFNAIREATSETQVSLALEDMWQTTPGEGTARSAERGGGSTPSVIHGPMHGVGEGHQHTGEHGEEYGEHRDGRSSGSYASPSKSYKAGELPLTPKRKRSQEDFAASGVSEGNNPSVSFDPHTSARVDSNEGSMSSGEGPTKPNVFFIMVDDMGWNDVGYQSSDLSGLTPNIDKLADGGIKLTNYYSMSICTPARASLMTGRYPARYGLQYNVIQPGAPWGLPLGEKLLPEYLNDAGYESHMVGKWHIGSFTHAHTPHRRGFKTFLGYLNDEERYWTHQSWTATLKGRKFFDFGFGNQSDYYDIIKRDSAVSSEDSSELEGLESWSSTDDPIDRSPNGWDLASEYGSLKAAVGDFQLVRAEETDGETDTGDSSGASSDDDSTDISSVAEGSYVGKYSTTIFTERAMEIVKSKTPYDDEPLFLYLAHQAVHDPLGLPKIESFTEEEWETLDAIHPTSPVRKRFAKVLFYLDKMVGVLVKQLEEEGWLENSIIVLASDNGGCPTNGGSNHPLRGVKHSYWEGGNKVPALIYSKSHLPESVWGTSYDGLMHVTDWLPTIVEAAGGDTTGSLGPLDGVSHWDYFISDKDSLVEPSPRTELLYNWDPYILWTDGDSIEEPDYPVAQGAFRQGKYKLLSKVWCSGYYTFDPVIVDHDPLVNHNETCQGMGTCSSCGQGCLDSVNYTDWLFDLESDPREEHNLIEEMPELAGQLRERAIEVAFSYWKNSSYADINRASYRVWSKMGWWMAPWYHLYNEGFGSFDDDDGDDDGDDSSS